MRFDVTHVGARKPVQSVPLPLRLGHRGVRYVSCGESHCVALTNDSEVFEWGYREALKLDGRANDPHNPLNLGVVQFVIPLRIDIPVEAQATEIRAGGTLTSVIFQSGTAPLCWFFVHISKNLYVSPAAANFRALRHANRCEVTGSESMSIVYGFDSTWPVLNREALEEAASPRSPARPRGAQQPQGFQLNSPSGAGAGAGAGAGKELRPTNWRTSFGTPLDSSSPSPARSVSPGRSPRRSARDGSPQASSRSGSPLASSRGRTPRHPRPRSPGKKTPRGPVGQSAQPYASEYGSSPWPPSEIKPSSHKPVLFNPPSRGATPRFTDRSVYDAAQHALQARARSSSGSPVRDRHAHAQQYDSFPTTSRTAREMVQEDGPRPTTMAGEHNKSRQLFEIQSLLSGRSSEDLEAITRLLRK